MKKWSLRLALSSAAIMWLTGCTRSQDSRDATPDTPQAKPDGWAQPDLSIAIDGGVEAGSRLNADGAGTDGGGTVEAGAGETGGAGGAGGTPGSGGATGTGGRSETGGAVGNGGTPGTGGTVPLLDGGGEAPGPGGLGGFAETGGTVGVGVGGNHGSGGAIGSGGHLGLGGTLGVGGSAEPGGVDASIDAPGEIDADTVDAGERSSDVEPPTVDAPDSFVDAVVDASPADTIMPTVGCLYEGTYSIPGQAITCAWGAGPPPGPPCIQMCNQETAALDIVVAGGSLRTEALPVPTTPVGGYTILPPDCPSCRNWTIVTNTPSELKAVLQVQCNTWTGLVPTTGVVLLDVDCEAGGLTVTGSCTADEYGAFPCGMPGMHPSYSYSLSGSESM